MDGEVYERGRVVHGRRGLGDDGICVRYGHILMGRVVRGGRVVCGRDNLRLSVGEGLPVSPVDASVGSDWSPVAGHVGQQGVLSV